MPTALSDLLAELESLETATEKLKFLLQLAAELPEFPAAEISENKISGCASNAYIVAECRNGKMFFRGDSDAQIPKGILAFFIAGCNEAAPGEIAALSPDILKDSGLPQILSPSRANGAYQIFARIQAEAEKCKSE